MNKKALKKTFKFFGEDFLSAIIILIFCSPLFLLIHCFEKYEKFRIVVCIILLPILLFQLLRIIKDKYDSFKED